MIRVPLVDIITAEVVEALSREGLEIVRYGEVPPWFEKVESFRAPLYRLKRIES